MLSIKYSEDYTPTLLEREVGVGYSICKLFKALAQENEDCECNKEPHEFWCNVSIDESCKNIGNLEQQIKQPLNKKDIQAKIFRILLGE